MPVKGLTDVAQPRYYKKIRLGIKGEKGAPVNTNYFVIEGAPEIEKVYGGQPKELHIQFASYDPEITMPTWNKWYDASGFLICRGDGQSKGNPGSADYRALNNVNGITNLTAQPGRFRKSLNRVCWGQDCPDHHARGCGLQSQIRFKLPLVHPYQIYQIDTGSVNTVLDFKAALEAVSSPEVVGAGATMLMKSGMDSGFGPVFKIFKVAEKSGGLTEKNEKITRSYMYLSIEICDDFWANHLNDYVNKISQISGYDAAKRIFEQRGMLSGRTPDVDTTQHLITARDEEMLTQEPERIDVESPPDHDEDPTVVAGQVVSQQQSLETDPEIIAAVKSVYDAKGKPMPKNAVKNALVRYNNDKAAVIAASRSTAAMPQKGEQAATPPPTSAPAQPASTGTTLL